MNTYIHCWSFLSIRVCHFVTTEQIQELNVVLFISLKTNLPHHSYSQDHVSIYNFESSKPTSLPNEHIRTNVLSLCGSCLYHHHYFVDPL